jgi:hypothetical protein
MGYEMEYATLCLACMQAEDLMKELAQPYDRDDLIW